MSEVDINQPHFDPDTRSKLAEVQLGLQTQDFLKSTIGRYLLGRAEIDEREGVFRLKNADPKDEKEIRAAQFLARLPDLLARWLDDAIVNGKNAEEQLQQQQDTQET